MRGIGRIITLITALLALVIPFYLTSTDFLRIQSFDTIIGATADSITRAQVLMGLIAALVVLTVGVFLVGRPSSNQQKVIDANAATVSQQYAEALALVRDVTSEPDVSVLVVDGKGKILFLNAAAAARAGKSQDDLMGRPITALFSAAENERMQKFILQALNERATVHDRRTMKSSKTNNLRMFATYFYPLATDVEGRERVLLIDRDISEAALERGRRRRSMDRLSDFLIKVASRMDRRTMVQALRISELAGLLAVKLELAPERVEAVKTAGKFLGFGRFFVSNQSTDTSTDLMRRRQEATATLAENLKDVDFEGPVVETLRQMYERWDGKGPLQRSGITIDPTARILSVSAAFLSMISARSDHHPTASIEQAAQSLMDGADTLYERRVVRALIQHLDEDGRKIWEEVRANLDAPVLNLTPNLNPQQEPVVLSDALIKREKSAPQIVKPSITSTETSSKAPDKSQNALSKKTEQSTLQSQKSDPEITQKTISTRDVASAAGKPVLPKTDKAPDEKSAKLGPANPKILTKIAPVTSTDSLSHKPPAIRIHSTPTTGSSKKESA